MLYGFALIVHSWLRWLVLGAGIALLFASFSSWRGGSPWGAAQQRLRSAAVGLMDLQSLLGLLLYFGWSPIAAAARGDMGAAMKDATLRFWGVEHIFAMLIALVVLHVGHVRAKKRAEPDKQRIIFVTQCVWLVLVLAAIPWPGLDIARPLFRF